MMVYEWSMNGLLMSINGVFIGDNVVVSRNGGSLIAG